MLLCVIFLSASRLYAYWTPTPVREECHVVLEYLLWCWLLGCLYCLDLCALLFLRVVLETPDVPRSLSSLSMACLMSLLAVLPMHLLPILCCVFLRPDWLYLGLSPRYESLVVWPVVCLLWYVRRCSRLNMYSLPVWPSLYQ